MTVEIFQVILDALNSDATLANYLGGERCFRAKNEAPANLPSITVMQQSDSSTLRVGYLTYPKRDNTAAIQVDIWVSGNGPEFPNCGEDADTISDLVTKILMNSGISGTIYGSWQKTTHSQQHEQDKNIWHNAMRFQFSYILED